MPYSAQISRADPSCFIFLIDQSWSMHEAIGGQSGKPKMHVVADTLNRLLRELGFRCSGEEEIRDYFRRRAPLRFAPTDEGCTTQ